MKTQTFMEREQPLEGMDQKMYKEIRKSGMFFVWYPKATGVYSRDTQVKVKKKMT